MDVFEQILGLYIETDIHLHYEERLDKLELLRREFVEKFPIKNFRHMSIDDYVVGKKNETGEESFCYWLETRLMELGKIKGGTTADKKFGVYYGFTKYDNQKKYRTIKKWDGELDPNKAFDRIKDEIHRLIKAGQARNYDLIDENKISPMFKGKILATYFPKDYLTIFSDKHLDYFLEVLPIKYDISKPIRMIDKQRLLLDFKDTNLIMADWSNDQFSKFLYTVYNPRNNIDQENRSRKLNVEFIDFEYLGKKKAKVKTNAGKQDFVEIGKKNQKVGLLGERIVYSNEVKKLKRIGRTDLATKVDHVSLKDDSLGYDILSYDLDGTEIHIEVKSTTAPPRDIHFYITDNELRKTLGSENHFIYLVYSVKTQSPKIHVLDKATLTEENLEPLNYRVRLDAKMKQV
ncbi:conserved protein of unknown function [Acetoanaerobium sticklandii]|uniref:Protein NO VEIN C-terminal domain-containing protein n=1 Tax=Acetoanaerobium sticklandii (strain ATCC 12662 / DSM 519 / JCM 1433 / CCUG 9281 / NCIMB 10654 / HF) TaxID=499177 RepID=E3PVS7_ACESD|nr:DUF3883 domain-containing protein [Acetoanaerobium sticklandii]CBH22630.1 conserved protein of unknown function [Acetoanaerobium sticklandii]